MVAVLSHYSSHKQCVSHWHQNQQTYPVFWLPLCGVYVSWKSNTTKTNLGIKYTWPVGFPAPAPSPSPVCSEPPCDDGSLAVVARLRGAPAPSVAPPRRWPGAPAEGSPGAAAYAAPPMPLTPSPAPPLDAQGGAPEEGSVRTEQEFQRRVKIVSLQVWKCATEQVKSGVSEN